MNESAQRKSLPSLFKSLTAAPLIAIAAAAAFWPWRKRRDTDDEGPPPCLTPEDFEAAEPGRGRAATAPWNIPAKGWKDILWRTYREIGRARLPVLAAGVTFFLLLATFPAIAAFVSVYGIFTDVAGVERQFAHIADFLPRDAVSVIAAEMVKVTKAKHTTLGATFALSTLVSIWSANAGMKALVDGVNVAYDETESRPWLRLTLVTYVATLSGLLLLTIITGLAISGPMLFRAMGVETAGPWLTPLRWISVYIAAAGVLTVIYRYGPCRSLPRWRWVAPGGLAAAALWMGGSLVYTWWLNHFTHFGVTYGSLGAFLGLMLWLWFSSMTVLVGAELNAEIEHQTAQDTTVGEARPLGQRGAAMADRVGRAFTVSVEDARRIVVGGLRDMIAAVRRFTRV